MRGSMSFAEINRIKVRKSVGKEFRRYRHKALRQSKKQIFDSYNKIGFYSLVYSYFTECFSITDEITNRLSGKELIIEELWQFMLTSVEFYINTWEDVNDMIRMFLENENSAVNY